MSYTLTITKEADYLHIEVTGIRTRDAIVAVAKDCLATCTEHGCTKLLVDIRGMTGRLPTLDAYEAAGKDLPKLRQFPNIKVAITDLHEHRDRFSFFENVAVNAGVDLRFFSDLAKASQWLRGSDSIAT